MSRRSRQYGYTLIELMMVVTVIGILGTIALTRYGDLLVSARAGALKGDLGAIRSALSIYYADVLTQYPASLPILTVNGKYLSSIPSTKIKEYHADSASVDYVSDANSFDDGAGWAYVNDPDSSRYGMVWINCTHTDKKGTAWSVY